MSYFPKFPTLSFKNQELIDITRHAYIVKEIKQNSLLYFDYVIKDGETPEFVAEKYYGDPNYNWVLFLMNDILNPLYDWPLTQLELKRFVNKKYENPHDIHHYEKDGFVVHPDFISNEEDYAVTNREYEERLNEQKRQIKIMDPQMLDEIEDQLKDIVNE